MHLFGVLNCSPDSLHAESIVTTPEAATARAESLLASGAASLDLGGQGSTDIAEVVSPDSEWERIRRVLPALVELGVDVSIDSWRPSVVSRSLEAGATVINASDGMQSQEMWEVAADFDAAIVIPFLSGPDPRSMSMVTGDPVQTIIDFFTERLSVADRYGLRPKCILDPGTGFAPPNWDWADRYHYQLEVYSNLDRLRCFGLPLYIALPWKRTEQHDELLEIVVRAKPEYGRSHYPGRVREVQAAQGTY